MASSDLLAGHVEQLARLIHDSYLRRRQSGGSPAEDVALVPWEDLPETLRRANRDQAAHIATKLDAIGCGVAPAGSVIEPMAFSDDETERLAQLEHDRWWFDRVMDGWTFAPDGERDHAARRSPYLAPWRDLPEHVRNLDREAVVQIPQLLSQVGLAIVRTNEAVTDPTRRAWHGKQVARYEALHDTYVRFAQALHEALAGLVRAHAPLALITSRAKSVPSFAEKILRKNYDDPLAQLTDLCGVRLIARTRSEVHLLSELIKATFDIDAVNSVDTSERLHPTQFGYRSVHYIVSFRPGSDIAVDLPEDLYGLRAEVQVRTVAEHAWADFGHDLSYKGAFELPPELQRELALVAAEVENIDEAFVRLEEAMRAYVSRMGAHLGVERARQERQTLETVRQFDRGNVGLVSRVARLAMAAGDLDRAIALLDQFRTQHMADAFPKDNASATVLWDLGVALCTRFADATQPLELARGRSYLERAAAALASPTDRADALTTLGDSLRPDLRRAREHYRAAFEADPTDGRALIRFLEGEIHRTQNLAAVPLLRPAIEGAVRRGRAQIAVGTNLGQAFATLGALLLANGDPVESLQCYAKAVGAASARFLLDEAIDSLESFGILEQPPLGYEEARLLLLLGSAVHFRSPVAAAALRSAAAGSNEPGILPAPLVVVVGTPTTGDAAAAAVAAAVEGLPGTVVHAAGGDVLPAVRAALQRWIDATVAGFRPADVTMLLTGNDRSTRAELDVALALQARVAAVGNDAVLDGLVDPDWRRLLGLDTQPGIRPPAIIALPADAETIRAFVGGTPAGLPPRDRDALAAMIHDAYVVQARQRRLADDTSLRSFDQLPPPLRESNYRQADHILTKVRAIDCTWERVSPADAEPVELTAAEVERLAEMEHGRWNAERLSEGWAWGPARDDVNRVHPHLVPWSELPEGVKDLDRAAVRAIPQQLAAIGLRLHHT